MILLIGGTSETAPLAAGLAAAGYAVLVSTATDTALAVGEHPRISRRTGRLDEGGLAALGREKGIRAIVDAAHPYAVEVHATAQKAAGRLGIPCLTFRRPGGIAELRGRGPEIDRPAAAKQTAGGKASADATGPSSAAGNASNDPVHFAAGHAEAAALAFADGRPVLLTTGSRNLAPYTAEASRTGIALAVRVLDTEESLAACRRAGIAAERIIAGRGPFTVEENLAAIRRFGIGVIVTKESGAAGGIDAKLTAARQAHCRAILIRRPDPAAQGPVFESPAALVEALTSLLLPAD